MIGNNYNFVIFGGTGDLSFRKLFPALFNLYKKNVTFNIIAVAINDYSQAEFIELVKTNMLKYLPLEFVENSFDDFKKNIRYLSMDFTNPCQYSSLNELLTPKTENIFYLAVAPRFFNIIGDELANLTNITNSKIVIEKPFGETLEDANLLNKSLEKHFGIDNIYHIDHYLGKEMVQNLLNVRFSNPIFANIWNCDNIECVQIISSEQEGVGTRASYYDNAGALKDMMQNHLLQMLSLVAMEEPTDDIKEKQVEVLNQLRPIENIDEHLFLGQYHGYTSEANVRKDSKTETLAFCKFYIDNKRWNGVPFYILTGKALKTRELNIIITFKNDKDSNNILTFKVQPNESISLTLNVKKPGYESENISIDMNFLQNQIPNYEFDSPEAYERLIFSVIKNDHTWFANWAQILKSWVFIENIKNKYLNSAEIQIYKDGVLPIGLIKNILDDETHYWS